ncbi:hypothetical protein BC628DRAFT_1409964 [Trametes gibbosa]|nr:hypothetical protein BC628DRAFT_1409964 [Trametes gibbosa]
MSDDESAPNSLTNYLSQAYLPALIFDEDLPKVRHAAPQWPPIQELDMDRPRLVRIVSEIPLLALQNAIQLCPLTLALTSHATDYASFESRLKVDWKNTRLTLPSPGMTVLNRSTMSHLVVNGEVDFLAALEYLILGTTAEAVRTIERRPFDEDELSFSRICVSSARNTRRLWTVYTFGPQTPPTNIVRPGIAILALPPWMLGAGDLQEFSSRRKFQRNELEKEPQAPSKPWSNATKVWAMVYDSCRVSGYRWFVVTTYDKWVFGTWSLEWSGADVTEPIPFDRTRGMSVVQILTFWLECARNKSRYWRISADVPRGY